MKTAQSGILALGTPSHAYLEFDSIGERGPGLVRAVAALRQPRTTTSGVNLVVGFRPELWRVAAPDDAPADMRGFDEDVRGVDGFVMPATQHDVVLWLSSSSYDVVFDAAHEAMAQLAPVARLMDETSSWQYQRDRDLTGFIDGTENPTLLEAPDVALIPPDQPGAGGTIFLLQKWEHDKAAWESLGAAAQERVIGRTKQDSIELQDKPSDSHVARTDQDAFGKIFRRNLPFGTVSSHGTMFVGFSADQRHLARMLDSMAGLANGVRDALTRYTRPLSGAYYFIPSAESVARMGSIA